MYVCICNAIRDGEVEALARQGIRSAEHVYSALGCEPGCATCTEELQQILDTTPVAEVVAA